MSNQVSGARIWASTVIALAFIALVGLVFWRATESHPDFKTVWTASAAIVGVVVGAIPSFFFQGQVRAERARSSELADRATALAATSTEDQVRAAADIAARLR